MYATALLADVPRRVATSEYTTINLILSKFSGRSNLARTLLARRNICIRCGDVCMLGWGKKVSASTARMLPVTLRCGIICLHATQHRSEAAIVKRVQPLERVQNLAHTAFYRHHLINQTSQAQRTRQPPRVQHALLASVATFRTTLWFVSKYEHEAGSQKFTLQW